MLSAQAERLKTLPGLCRELVIQTPAVSHGRITKRGSKTGRTILVQCSLAALKKSEYLKKYDDAVKSWRGHGKAKIALARKYLGIIYNTLINNWVFADFNNFELAE